MAPSDHERKARTFTDGLQTLLNSTLCDHAQVMAIDTGLNGRVAVGTGLNRNLETRAYPLRAVQGKTRCWLEVQGTVFVEPEGGYLTVESSFFGVSTDEATDEMLFHYDYERDKVGYPEAHLQVFGDNDDLQRILTDVGLPKQRLERLHFPVGGRRYRPALEDILEFLVDEGLSGLKDPTKTGRAAFDQVIKDSRDKFRERQLRAAIRRYPDIAEEALKEVRADQAAAAAAEKRQGKRQK